MAEPFAMDPLSALRDRFREAFADGPPPRANPANPPTASTPGARTVDDLPSPPTSDGARFVLARIKHEADAPAKTLAPSPRQILDPKLAPSSSERATATPSLASGVHVYTSNPHELPVKHTPWDAATLVPALQKAWPGLSETGARTLVCQISTETGFGGKNAYGYNFGNVKAKDASLPHQYLQGTWEPYAPEVAAAKVAQYSPSARVATAEDLAKHPGWACKPDEQIVVFSPPSAPSRFRAYDSRDAGIAGYVGALQGFAARQPALLDALNAGDTATTAHLLKTAGYYRGVESAYVTTMGQAKTMLDKVLGPVSS